MRARRAEKSLGKNKQNHIESSQFSLIARRHRKGLGVAAQGRGQPRSRDCRTCRNCRNTSGRGGRKRRRRQRGSVGRRRSSDCDSSDCDSSAFGRCFAQLMRRSGESWKQHGAVRFRRNQRRGIGRAALRSRERGKLPLAARAGARQGSICRERPSRRIRQRSGASGTCCRRRSCRTSWRSSCRRSGRRCRHWHKRGRRSGRRGGSSSRNGWRQRQLRKGRRSRELARQDLRRAQRGLKVGLQLQRSARKLESNSQNGTKEKGHQTYGSEPRLHRVAVSCRGGKDVGGSVATIQSDGDNLIRLVQNRRQFEPY